MTASEMVKFVVSLRDAQKLASNEAKFVNRIEKLLKSGQIELDQMKELESMYNRYNRKDS